MINVALYGPSLPHIDRIHSLFLNCGRPREGGAVQVELSERDEYIAYLTNVIDSEDPLFISQSISTSNVVILIIPSDHVISPGFNLIKGYVKKIQSFYSKMLSGDRLTIPIVLMIIGEFPEEGREDLCTFCQHYRIVARAIVGDIDTNIEKVPECFYSALEHGRKHLTTFSLSSIMTIPRAPFKRTESIRPSNMTIQRQPSPCSADTSPRAIDSSSTDPSPRIDFVLQTSNSVSGSPRKRLSMRSFV